MTTNRERARETLAAIYCEADIDKRIDMLAAAIRAAQQRAEHSERLRAAVVDAAKAWRRVYGDREPRSADGELLVSAIDALLAAETTAAKEQT